MKDRRLQLNEWINDVICGYGSSNDTTWFDILDRRDELDVNNVDDVKEWYLLWLTFERFVYDDLPNSVLNEEDHRGYKNALKKDTDTITLLWVSVCEEKELKELERLYIANARAYKDEFILREKLSYEYEELKGQNDFNKMVMDAYEVKIKKLEEYIELAEPYINKGIEKGIEERQEILDRKKRG